MSVEDISRSVTRLDIEDDAVSAKSDDSVETVRPAPPRRTQSAFDLRALPGDDVFSPSTGTASNETFENMASAVVPRDDQDVQQFRADRDGEITRANAQGKCPPDACLFAANMLDSKTEVQHEQSLHALVDVFGRNWIQIKEDRNRHSFAIIQFETTDAANNALRYGQGMICDGREIRLEKAKVDRALLITRMTGVRVVTEHEARDLLTRFGQIETICTTDLIPGRDASLPRGQYVRFMYWLDCRDALRHFHEQYDNSYRLQLANGLEPRQREYTDSGATIVTGLSRTRPNIDVVSVFVGNLPEDVTKPEVEEIFKRFGRVVMCNLIKKVFPATTNCFAFVEFSTAIEAELACDNAITLREHKLRIEPKEYTARRRTRLALAESPIGSPPLLRVRTLCRLFAPSQPCALLRVSTAAATALQERLAQNNVANNAHAGNPGNRAPNVYTPPHRRGSGPGNPY